MAELGQWRTVASLTEWGAVKLGDNLHLVGVLLGGHDRLPSGIWIITSEVIIVALDAKLAITASHRQIYDLRAMHEGPWPGEAIDLIERAMRKWRAAGTTPIAPLPLETLKIQVSERGLDRAAIDFETDRNE